MPLGAYGDLEVVSPTTGDGGTALTNNFKKISDDITNLQSLDAEKAPSASPTFTGTATFDGEVVANKALVETPVSLTLSGSTVNTDASLGNVFEFTASSNFTLANPTNGVDGQKVVWRIQQGSSSGGTITLGTNFALGSDITSITLSTAAGKYDYLGALYCSAAGKWHVTSFVRGY